MTKQQAALELFGECSIENAAIVAREERRKQMGVKQARRLSKPVAMLPGNMPPSANWKEMLSGRHSH